MWRDLNQDGVSQSEELFTLNSLGIASINVTDVEHARVLADGNRIADLGSYTKTDGTTGAVGSIADIDLVEDTFHREFSDVVPLAEGVAALPEMQGSGQVRDLREAASLSPAVKDLLTQFRQATTRDGQLALLDQLLTEWGATSGMEDMDARFPTALDSTGHRYELDYQLGDLWRQVDAIDRSHTMPGSICTMAEQEIVKRYEQSVERFKAMLTTLERFNGRFFFELPTAEEPGTRGFTLQTTTANGAMVSATSHLTINLEQARLDLLERSYESLRDSVYSSLAVQTRFKPLLDQIDLVITDAGMQFDFSAVEAELQARIGADATAGIADLIDFNFATRSMPANVLDSTPLTPAVAVYFDAEARSIAGTGELCPHNRDGERRCDFRRRGE